MKQCSSSNGRLPFTFSAKKETTPHQRWLLRINPANGATKTFRPSKFRNIIQAGIFDAKPFIKFRECSRIIKAGNWVSWLFHDHILHRMAGWVKCIPTITNLVLCPRNSAVQGFGKICILYIMLWLLGFILLCMVKNFDRMAFIVRWMGCIVPYTHSMDRTSCWAYKYFCDNGTNRFLHYLSIQERV